jgi:hypothetical protein
MMPEDAGHYITKLSKAEHEAAEWQAAIEALILVVGLGGQTMFARIGTMLALNRYELAGSVRVHSLRRRAGAGLPNAVLQRNCALRRVGFRTFLRRQDDHHDPHGAWHLARLEHSG